MILTDEQRERLRAELEQVHERGDKLSAFLQSADCDDLPQEDQLLLAAQLSAMGTYLAVLQIRLQRADAKAEAAQPAPAEPFTGDMPPGLLDVQAGDEVAGDCA